MNCTPKVGQNFWGVFMGVQKSFYRRHSLEYKMSLISRYESGATVRQLSAESGIYYTQIKEWLRQYRANGAEGLSMKNTRYPVSLKVEVVSKILGKELSLHQASIDFRITRSVIQKWIKRVDAQGIESLSIDNRGRHGKSFMDKNAKKPPVQLSREQELLNENERLRAEVAYLKKLRALVEERIARESGSEPVPSKD